MTKLIDADKLREQIEEWDCSPLWHESFPVLKLIDEAPDLSPNIEPQSPTEQAKQIAYDVCKDLPNGEEKDNIVYYAILAAERALKSRKQAQSGKRKEIRKTAESVTTVCRSSTKKQ